MRVFLIASAAMATVAVVVAAQRLSARDASIPEPPRATMLALADPIAAEAQVFRTSPGVLAIEPALGHGRAAHPRTLVTYRNLRAYPGAPPRIPHGLTPSEFQTGGCKACHERGGYSWRFDAYVPVTPHPEMGACLQCHVGDAKLMAVDLPNTEPSARCRQCHAPGAMRWRDSSIDWKTMAWPQLGSVTRGRNPPPIPHALTMRENCLACHSGPSGVAEIQTPHPERANCRQCHVEGAS
jgi:cytochrome c-type protein NapB